MTTLVTLRRLVTAIFCTTVIFFCSAHVAFAWGSYGPVMRGTTGVSISFNVTMGGLCAPYTTAPAPEGTAWMAGAAGLPTGVVALPALNNPGTFNYGCNSNPLNGPPDVVSVTVNDCPVYGLVWNGSACVPPGPPPATLKGGGLTSFAPASIPVGGASTLIWDTNNASSVTISCSSGPAAAQGAWAQGGLPIAGNKSVAATAAMVGTTNCTVVANGPGGSGAPFPFTWTVSSAPVNGVVGPANGVPVSSAPVSGLCSAGTPSAVAGSGPWTWTCFGLNGGSDAAGSAPVAALSVTANPVGSIPFPSTAFTVTYILTNGNAGNTNCRLLDSVGTPLTAYAPCSGSISWNTPAAVGTYGYRIQANQSSSGQTVQSALFNVVVTAAVPTLNSPTVGSVTPTGATLGANITSNGGSAITARGTCWGPLIDPVTNCAAAGGTALGVFTHVRVGMTPNTSYYARGYADNISGRGYSPSTLQFTTPLPAVPPPPTMPADFSVGSGAAWSVTMTGNGSASNCEFTRTSVAYGDIAPAMVGLNFTANAAPGAFIGPGSLRYDARCVDIYGQWSTVSTTNVTVAAPVPNLVVNPVPGVIFGSPPVGSVSVVSFFISNNGAASSVLTGNITFSDPHFTCPAANPTCAYNVPVGAPAVQIDITYRPTAVGSDSGNMVFTETGVPATGQHSWVVGGSGSPPVISVPQFVNFGTVPVTRYKEVNIVIRNVSATALPPDTFSIIPTAFSGVYTCIPGVPNTCAVGGIDLSVGAVNTVKLRFTPVAIGPVPQQVGTLLIHSGYLINIDGVGAAAVFNVKEK